MKTRKETILSATLPGCNTPAGRSVEVRKDPIGGFNDYYIFPTPAAWEPIGFVKYYNGPGNLKRFLACPYDNRRYNLGENDFGSMEDAVDWLMQ